MPAGAARFVENALLCLAAVGVAEAISHDAIVALWVPITLALLLSL